MHDSIALQGASQIFEFDDLWQLEAFILTLPAGIPFRHVYSVFALDTFVPIFSKNAPPIVPVPPPASLFFTFEVKTDINITSYAHV